jgi:hypothetical protein
MTRSFDFMDGFAFFGLNKPGSIGCLSYEYIQCYHLGAADGHRAWRDVARYSVDSESVVA